MIYYYEGNNITGLEYIYTYDDVETAAFAETILKQTYNSNDTVKSFNRNGKQIKIVFKENSYDDLTVEGVKATYSMLEEMKKN